MDDGYSASSYGDRWADRYDDWVLRFTGQGDAGPAVALLAGLAGRGRALELAIGTGRVALPLAAAGVDVHGIDASEAMIAKLREKPGGGAIPVTIGDFADVRVDGSFRLIYVVFNTFFALGSMEDQVRCFANVAARLTDDGRFVLEVFVPDVARFDRGQRVQAIHVGLNDVVIDAAEHDPVNQRVASSWIELRGDGPVEVRPIRLRYAWPSELDLMARLAALELKERWGGWNREPFDAGSRVHVSIYGRP